MNRKCMRAAVCALAVGLTACDGSETPTPANAMAPAEMSAALDFVVTKVGAIHTDTRSGLPPDMAAALTTARSRIAAPLPEQELFFVIDEALAALHDAHTFLEVKDETLASYQVLPLPFTWIGDGLIVTDDAGDLRKGDRIQSLGGRNEAAWLADLRGVLPAENDAFLLGRAPETLAREDFLRHFEALDATSQVAVEVERAGVTQTVSLSLGKPAPTPTAGSSVSHTIDLANSLGVLRLDACVYDQTYDTELRSFMSDVAASGLKKVAVDLRRNRGGNILVAVAFLAYLKGAEGYRSFGVEMRVSKDLLAQEPAFASSQFQALLEAYGVDPKSDDYLLSAEAVKAVLTSQLLTPTVDEALQFDGEVYVLTSSQTFSSANLFATLIQDNMLGKVVGDPTGNEIDFHGQNLLFDVPNTGFSLSVSSSHNFRPASDKPNQPWLTPDVLVPTTRTDIIEGKDAVLAWVSSQ